MKIFVAADHAGFDLKQVVYEHLFHHGHEVEDLGAQVKQPGDDYAAYAYTAAAKVLGEDGSRGIMICGSGEGMAMAANRVRGIRAAVVWNEEGARETREDNDSNMLALPARMIDQEAALKIVDVWLATPFSGEERHLRRIKQLDQLG